MDSVAVKKIKSLSGNPSLIGDQWLCFHCIAIAGICKGDSVIENAPDTTWFKSQLKIFSEIGYNINQDGTTLTVSGQNQIPINIEAAIKPRHETILFILGGILAASKSDIQISIDSADIPERASSLFIKLFKCEEICGSPHIEGVRKFKIGGLNSQISGTPQFGYLIKTGILYYHIYKRQSGVLTFHESLPEHIENLLVSHGAELEIKRSNRKEMSELEKRIARKLGKTGKSKHIVSLTNFNGLEGCSYYLPNDISQASIFILTSVLVPGSEIILENVLLSPSRINFISNLKRMGASIDITGKREYQGEFLGNIKVEHSTLKGRKFNSNSLLNMGDEIILLIIAGAFAKGETIFRDITFLREYDRDLLKNLIILLKDAGVEIGEFEDGLITRGHSEYDCHTYSSNNKAMLGFACFILGLKSHGESTLNHISCMEEMYPGTMNQLLELSKKES